MKKDKEQGIIKSGLLLFGITGILALVLAAANSITEPIVAAAREERVAAARLEVLPQLSGLSLGDTLHIEGIERGVTAFTRAYAGGQYAGSAFELTIQGAQGPIVTMLGLDGDGSVIDIVFLSHSETPGIGDRIDDLGFRQSFVGQNPLALNVDTITGATASSAAVINGIINHLADIESELGGSQ